MAEQAGSGGACAGSLGALSGNAKSLLALWCVRVCARDCGARGEAAQVAIPATYSNCVSFEKVSPTAGSPPSQRSTNLSLAALATS